ncbi:hypothetical protein GH714_002205 [Hevea brasiliensis]|uniref:Secreted protein n=1 Tax=Hevea brasiliensis TaxID=3981 RepID=A0A6A6LC61_HEVBR|nr:hypothetical protein GH714_002205 [Hevea brasiliensis]
MAIKLVYVALFASLTLEMCTAHGNVVSDVKDAKSSSPQGGQARNCHKKLISNNAYKVTAPEHSLDSVCRILTDEKDQGTFEPNNPGFQAGLGGTWEGIPFLGIGPGAGFLGIGNGQDFGNYARDGKGGFVHVNGVVTLPGVVEVAAEASPVEADIPPLQILQVRLLLAGQ